jgi:serine/threonine protein phosphatase PrpC
VGARIAVDVVADNVEPGDRFLLCSDGLSGPVADEELRQSLVRHAPSEAVEALLAQALARGAPDNVTAIIVAAQEATRLTFADAGGGRS